MPFSSKKYCLITPKWATAHQTITSESGEVFHESYRDFEGPRKESFVSLSSCLDENEPHRSLPLLH